MNAQLSMNEFGLLRIIENGRIRAVGGAGTTVFASI
jgi:hypothetical protein